MGQSRNPSLIDKIQTGNFVAGKFIKGEQADSQVVLDKYTQENVFSFANCTDSQVDSVVESSVKAHEDLKKLSAGEIYECLSKLENLVKDNEKELAQLIAIEAGKNISYAKSEVARSITTIGFAKEESRRFCGEVIPMDFAAGTGKIAMTKRFPKGVVFGVTPFNFPLNLVCHKVMPALATGCSIIIKPSPKTPLSALFLALLVDQAGFPKGSMNVLNCSNELCAKLVKHDQIKVFSFTGSDQVGWHLKNLAGKKSVQLELGGNAAVIVDENTDVKEAAEKIITGAYLYSGQICISTQRIFVQETLKETLVNELKNLALKIKAGDFLASENMITPLIDQAAKERVLSWCDQAKEQGASELLNLEDKLLDKNIIMPKLFSNVKDDSHLNCDEVFGPVAIIDTYEDFNQAIEMVNNSRFGLQVGVFSKNIDRIKQAFNELEVGGVIVGGVPGFRVDNMPYGGVKDSGLSREGLKYAMEHMSEERLLIM